MELLLHLFFSLLNPFFFLFPSSSSTFITYPGLNISLLSSIFSLSIFFFLVVAFLVPPIPVLYSPDLSPGVRVELGRFCWQSWCSVQLFRSIYWGLCWMFWFFFQGLRSCSGFVLGQIRSSPKGSWSRERRVRNSFSFQNKVLLQEIWQLVLQLKTVKFTMLYIHQFIIYKGAPKRLSVDFSAETL